MEVLLTGKKLEIRYVGMYKAVLPKVLDFIQTAWILDPSMFALDLINNNLDFHLTLALAQKQSHGIFTLNAF